GRARGGGNGRPAARPTHEARIGSWPSRGRCGRRAFEIVGRLAAGKLLRRRRPRSARRRPPENHPFSQGVEKKPRLPPRARRESPGVAREPSPGFTRLMSTGIVGSNPCGVILDTSSAAAGHSLRSRPSYFVLSFPPPAPLRRRFLAARR